MSTISATADAFWVQQQGERARAVFAAQGIRCVACSRSIEKAVSTLPGVERVTVNVATARVSVDFDPARTTISGILATVQEAGFRPLPLAGERSTQDFQRERRMALKRIGLAGIGMMQVMMYVLGVYVATPESIDPAIASYLRYTALLITTPVLFYSGAPYLLGALRDLRQRSLGMDVPVALALCLAYAASVFNTVRGHGETYFDSVTMFIFFLGAGRYVEMVVRQRSLSLGEAVSRSLPAHATRIGADGTSERIAVDRIRAGDLLSIPKGGVIPVDSRLETGTARVDESLVTGESTPRHKQSGEPLLGGSLNLQGPIRLIAARDCAGSTLASIVALLERAQSARPAVARTADRLANVFIAVILVLAAGVAAVWTFVDPARAFPAALAVLVVTCPCALSLATPVAVAAASMRLARSGLLVTRADALERLARIDTVVFDKTGTLTSGQPALVRVISTGALRQAEALAIAAALERGSSHPLAAAFADHSRTDVVASDIEEEPGCGLSGKVAGRLWRLGRPEWVAELAAGAPAPSPPGGITLGNARGWVASFEIAETLRHQVREAIASLRAQGVTPVLASGDQGAAVSQIARTLDIGQACARQSPAQKIEVVQQLQREGRRVLMMGDGINDGPVLAAANVSCAMGEGSAIAQAASDLLLLNDSMQAVSDGVAVARRMLEVIRTNLWWALAYNAVAIPLAALNLVSPWLAAIGMSASSLLVVLNAQRLARQAAT